MGISVLQGEVLPFGGELPRPVGNAQRSWSFREGVILRLSDGDGVIGQGEAAPLPGYSPDSLETCREQILAFCRALPLKLSGDGSAEEMLRALPAWTALSVAAPAARFAVETALLDLWGKRRGVSISALLGTVRQRVPISALLSGKTPEQVLASASEAVGRGMGTVKLKIGRDFARELGLVRRLRETLGPRIEIRLDANRSWPARQVVEHLTALAPLRPEFVEEPCADPILMDASGAGSCRVPLALDESLQGGDALALGLLEAGSCQVLVLKPMALGGFLRCLDLARLAALHGAAVLVTHLFDGPVALAAAAELALALPGRVLACGLSRHPGMTAGPAIPQLTATEIVPSGRPGLGLALWSPS